LEKTEGKRISLVTTPGRCFFIIARRGNGRCGELVSLNLLEGTNLTGFVGVKGGADFFHVGSVRADRFVELVAGDTELLGPIGDVGGHLGIDFFQIVRSFDMFLVYGVGLMDFGCIAVLGHAFFLLLVLSGG
jgi:hypothetical protein